VVEGEKDLVMRYHDILVDEHIENIMLFSPSLKSLTKRILFLLKFVAYLLISCSPSLHFQNPHTIQKLGNLQPRMTRTQKKSKKKT
jgi:hypothetical protein